MCEEFEPIKTTIIDSCKDMMFMAKCILKTCNDFKDKLEKEDFADYEDVQKACLWFRDYSCDCVDNLCQFNKALTLILEKNNIHIRFKKTIVDKPVIYETDDKEVKIELLEDSSKESEDLRREEDAGREKVDYLSVLYGNDEPKPGGEIPQIEGIGQTGEEKKEDDKHKGSDYDSDRTVDYALGDDIPDKKELLQSKSDNVDKERSPTYSQFSRNCNITSEEVDIKPTESIHSDVDSIVTETIYDTGDEEGSYIFDLESILPHSDVSAADSQLDVSVINEDEDTQELILNAEEPEKPAENDLNFTAPLQDIIAGLEENSAVTNNGETEKVEEAEIKGCFGSEIVAENTPNINETQIEDDKHMSDDDFKLEESKHISEVLTQKLILNSKEIIPDSSEPDNNWLESDDNLPDDASVVNQRLQKTLEEFLSNERAASDDTNLKKDDDETKEQIDKEKNVDVNAPEELKTEKNSEIEENDALNNSITCILKEEEYNNDEIVNKLINDELSLSDFSSSTDDISSDLNEMSWSSDMEVRSKKRKTELKGSSVDYEPEKSDFVLKDCCVNVVRLTEEKIAEEIKKLKEMGKEKEDREMKGLLKMRRRKRNSFSSSGSSGSEKYTPKKRKKQRYCNSKTILDSDSLKLDSDWSVSDGEVSDVEEFSRTPSLTENVEFPEDIQLNLLLGLSDPDETNMSSEILFSTSDGDEKKTSKDPDIKKEKVLKKKKVLDERKKWRNDPLLRGKLSSSDSDSDGGMKKKDKRKKLSPGSNDFDAKSVKSESGDSDAVVCSGFDKEGIKPVYEMSSIKLDSSESDSDIEFVKETKNKKSTIYIDTSESEDELTGKKGRRNIRAVISEEVLEIATKKAKQAEEERRLRISQKHKTMDSFLSQQSELSLEDEGIILDIDEETQTPLVTVNSKITRRLKPHQRKGVQFMWEACYESVRQLKQSEGSGCILAHCMGLGKSFQVVALIHTLFGHAITRMKHALIICPLSTVLNWGHEFEIGQSEVTDKVRVYQLSDMKKEDKFKMIRKWRKNTGVLVMGYEAYEKITKEAAGNPDSFFFQQIYEALVKPGPNLVVCDEGHLLKNGEAFRTRALMSVKTQRRIVLTGTPLQNNLREYYHMVQFVKPNLLGTKKEYMNRFVNPIQNGQYDDSTFADIQTMKKRSHVLHKLLRNTVQRYEATELSQYLPTKIDYVLFVRLHETQVELYKRYVNQLQEDKSFFSKGKMFAHYNMLQSINSHPFMLTLKEATKLLTKKPQPQEVEVIELDPAVNDNETLVPGWWKEHWSEKDKFNLDHGPKFKIMLAIIDACTEVDDKVLIFTSHLAELDFIEEILKRCKNWKKGHDYFRMDGRVLPEKRTELCDKFNDKSNKTTRVFLMSHKVGGLGLNLIAANRVIIMNVNWNPAYESQSIFRTYRFGQEKIVYIYRLVTMGTMEEVVYERSVTKLAIAGRVIDEHQIDRHYKSNELLQMFRLKLDLQEARPTPKPPNDDILAKLLMSLKSEIFKYHEHQALLENRPDEELNEEEMKLAWEEYHDEKTRRVEMAAQNPPQAPQQLTATAIELQQWRNYYLQNPANSGTSTLANQSLLKVLNPLHTQFRRQLDPSTSAPAAPRLPALQQPKRYVMQTAGGQSEEVIMNDILEKRGDTNGGPPRPKDIQVKSQIIVPKRLLVTPLPSGKPMVVPKISNVYSMRKPTTFKKPPSKIVGTVVANPSTDTAMPIDQQTQAIIKKLSRNGVFSTLEQKSAEKENAEPAVAAASSDEVVDVETDEMRRELLRQGVSMFVTNSPNEVDKSDSQSGSKSKDVIQID